MKISGHGNEREGFRTKKYTVWEGGLARFFFNERHGFAAAILFGARNSTKSMTVLACEIPQQRHAGSPVTVIVFP